MIRINITHKKAIIGPSTTHVLSENTEKKSIYILVLGYTGTLIVTSQQYASNGWEWSCSQAGLFYRKLTDKSIITYSEHTSNPTRSSMKYRHPRLVPLFASVKSKQFWVIL